MRHAQPASKNLHVIPATRPTSGQTPPSSQGPECLLEKVSGRSLQALIATLPGLGEYVASYSVKCRRNRLIEDLTAEGLEVNEPAIDRYIREGTPEQYLSAALQAAIHIMRGDNNRTSSYLARFWGPGQDRALTALFGADQAPGLIKNSAH